jgi:hypothetical protein
MKVASEFSWGRKNGGDNGFGIYESSNKLWYQNGKLQEDYLSESKVPSKNRKRCQNGKVEGDYLLRKRYQNVQKRRRGYDGNFSIHGFRIAKPRGLSFREFSRASNDSTKESKTVPG